MLAQSSQLRAQNVDLDPETRVVHDNLGDEVSESLGYGIHVSSPS